MFHTLVQGGVMMIPIGLCSLVGLTIVVERFIALRRGLVFDERVLRLTEGFSEKTSPDAALAVCRQAHGAFARLIEECLRVKHLEHDQIIETMHASGRTQIAGLERGLNILEIVAGVSPLLGLLGTVLGMIRVFNAITAKGIGNPQVLSSGIAEALITTVAGLCVAIPAVACHSWLAHKVDDYATEMQERATAFVVRLLASQKRRGSE
ncbi:MAG TPA: MotA/TolQ/ExbB proton channel family protein [Candidatus Hydrogenedentes bacterium]|nr:MotA/TolQ/ExbB proton channel family protein [Candidatus Hydrogenedentota bacterium]HOL77351.1 MotA/TolQ/ExbB proton channel family protein [Candidatus Hydrogenedentota bacterium]HPO84831.1 MotA/TolQ/ExbB proton channel family protein [Candidatus Hydrogenedentota bacterium]